MASKEAARPLTRAGCTSTGELGRQVYQSFSGPALQVIGVWAVLSGVVITLSTLTRAGPHYFLLFSSLASLVCTLLILFAGFLSGEKHMAVFCNMFITACLRVGGFSEEWMEANDPWCYISAIVGQLGALTAMGWSFAIIVDLLIITFYPSRYATKESRRFGLAHALIWMTATCSIIPALSTGSIGLSPDGTCWMLGPYIWAFWGFWFIFVAFALGAIAAIFWKLSREGRADDSCAASQPHVKVVTQLSLITLVFFLNWVWNGVFQMMLFSNQQAEKRWLVAIQIFWLGGTGILDCWIWLPFILNAIKRFRLIMQYRHTISSIMGQRDSTDTDCFGKGNSTAVNEICAVNSSIQRITQIQQSRLEYQMKDTQSPSQDMYSIDYDVDNVIDQLLAEQFSTWGGGSMSTTVSGGGVHEMRIRSISHNEVSSADQAGMGSPILWRMNS